MNFCPICANFLALEKEASGFKFKCRHCNYYYPLFKLMQQTKVIKSKEIAEILETENVQPIGQAECPKCGHDKAYFQEMQTRSADEAATIIYSCVKCDNKWSIDR
ncbi:RNA polymerase III C11 subunit [Paramecium bursaria]